MALPEKLKISIHGRTDCVASRESYLALEKEGDHIFLKGHDETPGNDQKFDGKLSSDVFAGFWEAFIALEPGKLEGRYDAIPGPLGSFFGGLDIEYTVEGEPFSKAIVLAGDDDGFSDERIKSMLRLIKELPAQSGGPEY